MEHETDKNNTNLSNTERKNDQKDKKKPSSPKKNDQKGSSFLNNVATAIIAIMILIGVGSFIAENGTDAVEIPISELAAEIRGGNVKEITVEGEKVTAVFTDDTLRESKKEDGTALSETLVNYGVNLADYPDLKVEIKKESGIGFFLLNALPFLAPLLLILFFLWLLTRQAKGGAMQAFSFGQSRARIIDPSDKNNKITFKDIAGAKEAKEELKEIVDFLRSPKKFLDIGAQIPKGVVLMGAPGTGKTLLARGVAGEANVPFFSISGSEFVEMFVGVGASRVRDLFKMAKKAAPAIIFVDEIDAVGRTRGSGVGGGNDEREQTLNQILVEMDGFEPNEKVIVMAATNRPDVLDPALLRPGRFDRRVTVDLPDLDDREEILKVHVRKKPLAEDVKLRTIAERTPGFSGADLYSLVNEAAILAAREDRKKVAQFDLIRSIEKVILGPERKSHILSPKEKEVTAYHEAGHALVASVLPHTAPVHKISIISRGRAAGYVLHLPLEEKKFKSRKQFNDDLAVTLAGYAAEKFMFDQITTGPSSDLQTATSRARDMVTLYGMSDEIGPVALQSDSGVVIYGRGKSDRAYSERVASEVDKEIKAIVSKAEERAHKAIVDHRNLFEAIAKRLIEEETIERDEFEAMLKAHGITPKKAEKIDIPAKEDLFEESRKED